MSAAKKIETNEKSATIKVVKNEAYSTINLVGKAGADTAADFQAVIPELIDGNGQDVMINCEHLSELSTQWIRHMMQLHQKLKQKNKQLRLIYVNENVLRYLRQEGVESSLKVMPNLHAALTDIGHKGARTLDVNFINPFLISTVKVLETQASTKATAGQIYKKDAKEKYSGDISGVIGLVSEAFSGSVVISFPAQTFLKIMSRMLGEEFTEMNKDIQDGAGEFTNIIFGQAKVLLNEQGFGIKTALPSVVSGNDHSIIPMSSGPRVVVPFQTDVGPFFIEVCVST